MVRSYALPAMENVALWHERDISHSSVERYIGPDATITLDFALARMTGVIDKLLVYPKRMQENLDKTHGLVHSQRVLLALTQVGLPREDSYRLVQKHAMRAWNGEGDLLTPAEGRSRGRQSPSRRPTGGDVRPGLSPSSKSTRFLPESSVNKTSSTNRLYFAPMSASAESRHSRIFSRIVASDTDASNSDRSLRKTSSSPAS